MLRSLTFEQQTLSMQKLLFLLLALFCSISLFSQNSLLTLYSEEQLADLKISHPEVIEYWNIYLDRGWVLDVIKTDQELSGKIKLRSNSVLDKTQFDPLEYGIFPKEGTQYIGIENSELVLIVYPKSHIIYHFNENKNK